MSPGFGGTLRMTLESFMNRLAQYGFWLYYRKWELWEVVAVGAVIVFVLLLVGHHNKAKTRMRNLGERSPIVGIRLAGHKRH